MVGVPKSRGCKTCKQRKLKCDENWPSCAHCRKRNFTCPGPTTLVKFIYSDSNGLSSTENHQRLPTRVSRSLQLQQRRFANMDNGAAQYSVLGAGSPQSYPTTLAGRVIARFVSYLDRAPPGLINLHLAYLPLLPDRIAESHCLRDAVDLFCAAWGDSRRQSPRGELMVLPQYGKALRSLQRALISDEALKAETLAATTLLERSGRLFDRRKRSCDVHLNGVVQLAKRKGPPDINDVLDTTVCLTIRNLCTFNWVDENDTKFLKESPWKEVLDQATNEIVSALVCDQDLLTDAIIMEEFTKELNLLIAEFKILLTNPLHDDTRQLSSSLYQKLRHIETTVQEIASRRINISLERGILTKTGSKGSITDTAYWFRSLADLEFFLTMFFLQLVPQRIMQEIHRIYDTLDHDLHQRFRDTSVCSWKALPYIRSLEPLVAHHLIVTFYLTYQAADEKEGKYLIDTALMLDGYLKRFPTDPKEMEIFFVEKANMLIGTRAPFKLLQENQGKVSGEPQHAEIEEYADSLSE